MSIELEKDAPRSPIEKALRINLDNSRYGSFAEIGAGQEVARFFFLAGKASHTIAKSMSAYDMTFSDEIYGREANGRYVCDSRLDKMLTKEYDLLVQRLGDSKGADHSFFAFANTCSTGDVNRSHGWLGIRYQAEPKGPTHDVILHVRMLDKHRLLQQESLGVLGVNLIHSAFYSYKRIDDFLNGLMENIKEDQIVIDLLRFNGPTLKHFDNRIVNLELVRRRIADATLFSPKFEVINLADACYNKALLIQRGQFSPVSKMQLELFTKGMNQLKKEVGSLYNPPDILPILEISLAQKAMDSKKKPKNLSISKNIAPSSTSPNELDSDLLDRIEMMTSAGYHVLVSNMFLFYKLKKLFRMFTNQPISMIMSIHNLAKIFEESYYLNLDGGIAEGVGRLLDENTRLFIHPDQALEKCLATNSADSKFFRSERIMHLFKFFMHSKLISNLENSQDYDEQSENKIIIDKIRKSENWQELLPKEAVDIINKRQLFQK